MRTPRHFTLRNGSGDICNITTTSILFHDLNGLGYEREDAYRRVGDRFVLVASGLRQQTISGKVALTGDDPYESYFNFVQFCNNTPLILIYQPNPSMEGQKHIGETTDIVSGIPYERNVRVRRMEKTEINQYGYLDVGIEFDCLTPWYKPIEVITDPTDTDDDMIEDFFTFNDGTPDNYGIWPIEEASHGQGNPHDLGYYEFITDHYERTSDTVFNPNKTYYLESGFNFGKDVTMNSIIDSNSYNESPCRLCIYGPISNPRWTHYIEGYSGPYATGGVDVTIPDGRMLVVDNSTDPYEISIYTTDNVFVESVYQNSLFDTERFIDIQYGRNQIRVTGTLDEDNNAKVPIKLEAKIYYDSV